MLRQIKTQTRPPALLLKAANRFPITIRNGDVEAKIYRTPTRIRGSRYDTYTLCWHLNGRQRRRFSDLNEAKREGERIVREKALGTLAVSAISTVDRINLERALGELAKADGSLYATIPGLIEVVRDYTAARVALPKGATLAEAAQFFAQRHPANIPRKTVAEIAAEFIADRASAGCSEIHLRDLRIRFAQQFTTAFVLPMVALTAPLVQAYIYGLQNTRTRQPASNRSKENMLRCVVSLANFDRRMKYIPAELAVELSEIPTPKK